MMSFRDDERKEPGEAGEVREAGEFWGIRVEEVEPPKWHTVISN